MWDNKGEFIVDNRVDTRNLPLTFIRLYKYGYAQVILRKMGWNNKEILLKINM
jgi:hypothetical protein